MEAGGTVKLVGSWSIVDALYHSIHICLWILVESCALTAQGLALSWQETMARFTKDRYCLMILNGILPRRTEEIYNISLMSPLYQSYIRLA
ncbi:unnamed protein product [Cuscuta campestris]|uniref:Uncharacterized protein n=1 Tax=Cuscuta campestris TaxID=132261 RepID=A0A484K1V0_9ASTE|nr:unnamed protein product [Cuscuta campestris]